MAEQQRDNSKTYISSATTTNVKTSSGQLIGILVGETAAGSIKLYDDADGTSDQFGELKASIAEGWYPFNCQLTNGLTIVTAAASKITVIHSR